MVGHGDSYDYGYSYFQSCVYGFPVVSADEHGYATLALIDDGPWGLPMARDQRDQRSFRGIRSDFQQSIYNAGGWAKPYFRKDYPQHADISRGMSTAREVPSWELHKKDRRNCADVGTLKREKSLPQKRQEKLLVSIEDYLVADGDADSSFEEQEYVDRIGQQDIAFWKQGGGRNKSWKYCSQHDSAKQQV